MAWYALSLGMVAVVLNRTGARQATDLVIKFMEHFALIREALNGMGLWNEEDGFFYDQLVLPDGTAQSIKVHSMVGVIPLLATIVLDHETLERGSAMGRHFAELVGAATGEFGELYAKGSMRGSDTDRRLILGVVGIEKVERLVARLLDDDEFLAPHGLRALSAHHRAHPYAIDIGDYHATIDYEPAESTTYMFGGNSNWRGPIWFPLNYLACDALERLGRFFGPEELVSFPTGTATKLSYEEIARAVRQRVVSTFLLDEDGARPCLGSNPRFRDDPRWRDNVVFHEYFHGDTGAGLGATHQTGWTGLVADLIFRIHGTGATGYANVFPQAARAT